MKISTKLVLFGAALVGIIASFIVWRFPSISATSVVSLGAFYISIAAFAWGRLDKDRDRAASDRQAVIAKAAVDAAQEQAQNYLRLERPYLYIFNLRGPKHITDVEDPYFELESITERLLHEFMKC